jgi:hypothetical protein
MPSPADHIGEVVESHTAGFRAQARELHGAPALGALVRVESEPVAYGIVFNVETGSLDAHRRPVAYGLTEEELRREQPQIFELLKTEFEALLVGYREGDLLWQTLPPYPPRLHSFVYECPPEEVRTFTEELDFLRLLVQSEPRHLDELLLAVARQAIQAHEGEPEYVTAIGQEIARLIGSDYDRLRSIIRRLAKSTARG